MSLVKQLETWKSDLEELAKEKGKAEGRLEQAMSDLEHLGFKSLEDAKIELDRRKVQQESIEEEVKTLLESFKVKYAGHIEV
jgi:seryl-tRNA synthetase